MKNTTFLSLDLELTQPSEKIIEVGVCIGDINATHDRWETRNWYLDPQEPISEFITNLTGITDDTIREKAVPVCQMAEELTELIEKHQPFVNPVTWGGGDTSALLNLLRDAGQPFPYFGRRWIDVKTIFTFFKMTSGSGVNHRQGLRSAMQSMRLTFEGEQHRAGVDAMNTLRLWQALYTRQNALTASIKRLSEFKL